MAPFRASSGNFAPEEPVSGFPVLHFGYIRERVPNGGCHQTTNAGGLIDEHPTAASRTQKGHWASAETECGEPGVAGRAGRSGEMARDVRYLARRETARAADPAP